MDSLRRPWQVVSRRGTFLALLIAFAVLPLQALWLLKPDRATAQFKPAKAAKKVDGNAPWQRVLTGADASRVEELDKKATELLQAGKYAEAQRVAREILTIRTRVQGVDLWQTADAKRLVETLDRVAGLPPGAQADFSKLPKLKADAYRLVGKGRYAEAEPLLGQALEIRRRVLGDEHPDTATSYNDMAMVLVFQGKHSEGVTLNRQALQIRRKVLGEQHPDTAQSYNNVAYNLNAQAKYAEAEPHFRQALEIRRKVLGEEHPFTAASYNNVAYNLNAEGKYGEAEPLYRLGLEVRRKVRGEEHPDTAQSYNNVASNLDAQGKYAEAEPLYRKALNIFRKVLGEEHPDTGTSYNNVASNLNAQGKYVEAELLLRRGLEVRRRVRGEEHADTAQSYNNVAMVLVLQGKHAEALPLHRQALEIRRRVLGEEHPDTAQSYNNVAYSFNSQGRYAEAEPLIHKALEIYRKVHGEEHPRTLGSYNNAAINLILQGKYSEAEAVWIKAAQSFDAARRQITTAGLERAAFGAEHSPLIALAAVLARRGKPADAWQQWESNLARGLFEDLTARPRRFLNTDERAREQELFAKLQRLDVQITAVFAAAQLSAEQLYKAEELSGQRLSVQAELSQFEQELTRKYGVARGEVYDLARIQAQLPPAAVLLGWLDIPGQAKAADPNGEHWACLVRQRGGPLWIKLPGTGPEHAWTKADDDLPAKVRQVLALRPDDRAGTWKDSARRLYVQRLAPITKHLGSEPNLAPVQHLIILPSSALRGIPIEALGDEYTISYAPSGTIFAWLQEKRQKTAGLQQQPARLLALGDPAFAHPKAAPQAEPAPPDQGALITMVVPGSSAAGAGIRPGDVLLSYAGSKLTGPGDLAAALQKAGGSAPANAPTTRGDKGIAVTLWREGKSVEVSIAPGKMGVGLHDKPVAEAILAKREADKLIRGSRGPSYAALPGTRSEVGEIARLFPQALTLFGSDASAQRLAQEDVGRFAFLHFATHGDLNSRWPMRSALVLAQDRLPDSLAQVLAGKDVNDGRLTAERILQTWRLDADLVTLSACRTGVSEKYEGGEGYLGFSQALFLAGARSLVLSLWQVDDTATALFMIRFYQNLLGKRPGLKLGLPKAEALAEAKRWLRGLSAEEVTRLRKDLPARERVGKTTAAPRETALSAHPYEHPYYWSAFILIGDPN